jgi:hypothetical protein
MTQGLKLLLNRGVEVFIYDNIVHTPDWTQLHQRLEQVFVLLSQEGLTYNAENCVFFSQDVSVVGHRITPEGCSSLQDKLQTIREWKEPRTRSK